MIRHIPQTGTHGDCCIATLATLIGLTYEEVLIEAAKVRKNVLKTGLHWTDLQKVGRRLKLPLQILKPSLEDLEDMTGMLGLKRMNPDHNARQLTEEHTVYLWQGRIIEGNGDHWLEVEDYLATYNFEITGLLVIRGEK